MSKSTGTFLAAFAAFAACMIPGCASSGESAGRQGLTEQTGVYPPPPAGLQPVRVGVPPFESSGRGSGPDLNELAADQMTTLVANSDRFDVIERTQLEQLLKEQGLEGIVKAEELAQAGKVRGVDYLLLGKVTNLRVKAESTKRGFGFGNVPIPGAIGSLGGFDYTKKESTITAECGVDIRLVDSTSGKVAAAKSSDYKRTDTIGAFGIEILGASSTADADLQLDEDNKGAILRLALDQAFRDMLPRVDKALLARGKEAKAAAREAAAKEAAASAPEESLAPAAAPATETPAGAKKFCSGCGAQLAATTKFCAGCGAKVEG